MGSVAKLPRAGKAQAEERVRELEGRVAELLRAGDSPSLWRAMEELRQARVLLGALEFRDLVNDLGAHRQPRATSKAGDGEDKATEVDRPPDVA